MKQFLLTLMLIPALGWADLDQDVGRVRGLLKDGFDIAQIRATLLHGGSEADGLAAARQNFVIRDINADGFEDVLVISELNPWTELEDKVEACNPRSQAGCWVRYGPRILHLFLGRSDGAFREHFANITLILGADEGGVMGDPLQGLSVEPDGTIEYGVYGGSSARWWERRVFQWRDGDFFVVADASGWIDTISELIVSKRVDRRTGQVVESRRPGFEGEEEVLRSTIPLAPLERVALAAPLDW